MADDTEEPAPSESESPDVEPDDDSETVETTRCPSCAYDNELDAVTCANTGCGAYLKTELECLRAIDVSLRTVKRIAVWWLVLSILGFAIALLYVLNATLSH